LAVPGLIFEKIRDLFPLREQRIVQEIILGANGLQHQIRTAERILFFSEDKKTFVQLGPRLLAVNSLKPYPGWAGFKPKIEKAFEALRDTLELKGLERIGLRYINRIEIPSERVQLDKYFRFYLAYGVELPRDMVDFIASADFLYADGRDRCRVQLRSASESNPVTSVFILDIDYFLVRERGVEVKAAMDWVEEAHTRVEEVFESCITESLRELFN